jgi:hypothetical protein
MLGGQTYQKIIENCDCIYHTRFIGLYVSWHRLWLTRR